MESGCNPAGRGGCACAPQSDGELDSCACGDEQACNEHASAVSGRFPAFARGWYHVCGLHQLRRGPLRVQAGGRRLLLFLTGETGENGAPGIAAMDANCCHMGARLDPDSVLRDAAGRSLVKCHLHGWEFDSTGRCVRIPAMPGAVPEFARQAVYPVGVLGSHVYICNTAQAPYPLPFFDGLRPEDLYAARPFEFVIEAPWPIVASNPFDVQHFALNHERQIIGEPRVDVPHVCARRFEADFEVMQSSMRDRVARRVNGAQVRLTVTCWSGSLLLVVAKLRSTASYGHLTLQPLGPARTLVRVMVWVPRARTALGQLLFKPIDAAIRRWFIRDFVVNDINHLAQTRYSKARMIGVDRTLVECLDWLGPVSWGRASILKGV